MRCGEDWLTRSGKARRAFTLELLRLYGWRCCICGLPIRPGDESVEHLTPRSKGGLTTLESCRPAHRRCNRSVGNRGYAGPGGLI
ncbi:HNH endonuclease, partial [Aerococcus urinae]|uniref:HNH endonuclease n=1 Tax=Aerococcus urinae TaxID=1376 RepID=UPI003D7C5F7F